MTIWYLWINLPVYFSSFPWPFDTFELIFPFISHHSVTIWYLWINLPVYFSSFPWPFDTFELIFPFISHHSMTIWHLWINLPVYFSSFPWPFDTLHWEAPAPAPAGSSSTAKSQVWWDFQIKKWRDRRYLARNGRFPFAGWASCSLFSLFSHPPSRWGTRGITKGPGWDGNSKLV